MRITKAWLRSQKLRIEERVKAVFKLSDEDVAKMLKNMFPNVVPGTREENIQTIILLSIDEFYPPSLMW